MAPKRLAARVAPPGTADRLSTEGALASAERRRCPATGGFGRHAPGIPRRMAAAAGYPAEAEAPPGG